MFGLDASLVLPSPQHQTREPCFLALAPTPFSPVQQLGPHCALGVCRLPPVCPIFRACGRCPALLLLSIPSCWFPPCPPRLEASSSDPSDICCKTLSEAQLAPGHTSHQSLPLPSPISHSPTLCCNQAVPPPAPATQLLLSPF